MVFPGQLVRPAGESFRVSFFAPLWHAFQLSSKTFKTQTWSGGSGPATTARYALEVMPSLDEEKR
jgi:hypothetical protein